MWKWLLMVVAVGSVFAVTGSWELLKNRMREVKSVTVDAGISGDKNYVYWRLGENDRLGLILNLPEKDGSLELMENNGCRFGINGGFYGQDDSPIGLLIIDGKMVHPAVRSGLLNGFMWVDNAKQQHISRNQPGTPEARFALQSGPVLVENGKSLSLFVDNDNMARRMVAVKLVDGSVFFMAVYDQGSRLDGPKLMDLPEKVMEIASREGWTVESAINLDGGAASAFHSPEVSIPEWKAVGTWWCAGND